VRGLDAIRAARCDVLATSGTLTALGLDSSGAHALIPFAETGIGDLTVVALPTSHDAAQPCGYSIADATTRITVLTDLGAVDDHIPQWLAESDLVVIESNHDVHMLRSGPYPPHLKRRVQSRLGHLSNADCAASLAAAFSGSVRGRTVWLAHLSATNNRPDLAVRTVRSALVAGREAHEVVALPRRDSGPVWDASVPRPAIPSQLSLFGH
jgi:phosphoribosyl 1,2-cyclic phosphodiesterase